MSERRSSGLRQPAVPAEVVLRSLHVTFGRNEGAVEVEEIVKHARLDKGVVLEVLLALTHERLVWRKRIGGKMLYAPWDGADVPLSVAQSALLAAIGRNRYGDGHAGSARSDSPGAGA